MLDPIKVASYLHALARLRHSLLENSERKALLLQRGLFSTLDPELNLHL